MSGWQILGAVMVFGPFVAVGGGLVYEWVRCANSNQWKDLLIGGGGAALFLSWFVGGIYLMTGAPA